MQICGTGPLLELRSGSTKLISLGPECKSSQVSQGPWHPGAGAWEKGKRSENWPLATPTHSGQIRGLGVRKPQGLNPGPETSWLCDPGLIP